MLGPFDWVIPIGVLGASLLGSAHCVGMCGGLVLAASQGRSRLSHGVVAYHLGRLLGYVTLGGLLGALGQKFFDAQLSLRLSQSASVLLSLGFLYLGYRAWTQRPAHIPLLPKSVLARLLKLTASSPAATGWASAFLPCGWLHSFLLAALATQSFKRGALTLLFFWLGTLPALGLAPWLLASWVGPWASRWPRLAGMILISLGIFNLGWRLPSDQPQVIHKSCHSVSQSED